MVDAYILSNLQESLGITDDQFVKLLPMIKRLQTDRRDHAVRRVQSMRQLRRLLRAGGGDARVLELLKEIKSLEAEHPERLRKNLEAIDGVLTPIQQAKFRVLELEVEFRIREIMSQIRRPDRDRPGPRRPGGDREPPGQRP